MNQLDDVSEGGRNEVNLFGIQLEDPMPNDVGKSLHLKPIGLHTDAFSSYGGL